MERLKIAQYIALGATAFSVIGCIAGGMNGAGFALVGWIGEMIIGIVCMMVTFIVNIVSGALEFAARMCECVYEFFLNAIVKQIEKV